MLTSILSIIAARYFTDAFNYFDLVVLSNFLAVVMIRLVANSGGARGDPIDANLLTTINILMSVGGTCLWIRLLEVFGVHPTLGPLLEMIKKMSTQMAGMGMMGKMKAMKNMQGDDAMAGMEQLAAMSGRGSTKTSHSISKSLSSGWMIMLSIRVIFIVNRNKSRML